MTPWEVIEQALARRRPPRDQAWLAEQLHLGAQAITNWKTRGVPAKRFRQVASLFGLTVDQVEGIDPLPWAQRFDWPFSAQLQERVEKMTSEELCGLEQKIWDALGEQPPVAVKQQLERALATFDKMSLQSPGVEQITSERKAKPKV